MLILPLERATFKGRSSCMATFLVGSCPGGERKKEQGAKEFLYEAAGVDVSKWVRRCRISSDSAMFGFVLDYVIQNKTASCRKVFG